MTKRTRQLHTNVKQRCRLKCMQTAVLELLPPLSQDATNHMASSCCLPNPDASASAPSAAHFEASLHTAFDPKNDPYSLALQPVSVTKPQKPGLRKPCSFLSSKHLPPIPLTAPSFYAPMPMTLQPTPALNILYEIHMCAGAKPKHSVQQHTANSHGSL